MASSCNKLQVTKGMGGCSWHDSHFCGDNVSFSTLSVSAVLTSLCIAYFFVAVFTWLSPPITGLIGDKLSLFICGFLYWWDIGEKGCLLPWQYVAMLCLVCSCIPVPTPNNKTLCSSLFDGRKLQYSINYHFPTSSPSHLTSSSSSLPHSLLIAALIHPFVETLFITSALLGAAGGGLYVHNTRESSACSLTVRE